MSFVEGFQISERLYESENSLVFRAVRTDDLLPVIIKILKNDFPTPSELSRYRQEYEIASSLNIEGVVEVYEQRRHNKTLLLVIEDFGGTSMQKLLKDRSLSPDEFLDTAIQVTTALGQIHSSHVIHKDINPANLVVNTGTGEVKIIDFGISTRFSTEKPLLKSPDVLEGTLPYMSPEQTGRMNRMLDYRTDFYSLGATLYEILTGHPPFESDDHMELVHCHIAREPVPAHRRNSDVPLPISRIVGKLLAKTAEDRYQSAAGLLSDLEAVRSGVDRFVPGRADYSDRFHIPERLYGREDDLRSVLQLFERTRRGRVEMLLVSGYSGVGKTALIKEVYKPITLARGYFVSGKFEQLQRNVPYSVLVAAFRDLVRQLLTESEAKLAAWRALLNDALAPNAQVMIDVLPDLELVIGPQPPVPELEAAEAMNRFNLAVVNLIRAFCAEDHPLVVFLDDLQWADSATLQFLDVVMTDDKMRHLFLIGAYRDNEVDAMHPLPMMIKKVQDKGGQVTELALAPLALADVTQLLVDTLHRDVTQIMPLAKLVVQKTQGNPLFVGQFLGTLHQDGLLSLAAPEGGGRPRWEWNIEATQAAAISVNVVDILLRKLRRLDDATQDALRYAACIGNHFDVETLALIRGSTPKTTFAQLMSAVGEDLVRPLSAPRTADAEDVLSPLLVEEFSFQHDRVQQAAYSLFREDVRKEIHLSIGRRLLKTLSARSRMDRLFEVVDHLNVGHDLITDTEERLQLAQLNLDAGTKAWESTAYAAALEYLHFAHKLLPGDAWETNYRLSIDIHRLLAQVEYLNGNFDRCRDLVEITLAHARTELEKAEVYCTRIVQLTLLTDFTEALKSGQRALRLLGVHLPLEDLLEAGQAELGRVGETLGERSIATLIDSPDVDSPEMRLAHRCIKHLLIAAFLSNQDLWPVLVALGVRLSLEHGNAPESALTYANYGLIIGAFMGRYHDGHEFGKLALRVCERFHGRAPTAAVCLVMGSELIPWVSHARHSLAILDRGYKEALDSGDILWAGYLVMYRVVIDAFRGRNLDELLNAIPDQIGFVERTQNQGAANGILAHQIVQSTLTGRTKSSTEFAGPEIDEAHFLAVCEKHHSAMAICFYKILKAQALYLFGRPGEALKATRDVEGILTFIVNHPNLADHKLYQSLSIASLYKGASTEDQVVFMKQLSANLEQLTAWAESCPDNYRAKHFMVAAEIARLSGDDSAARGFYDEAIDAAHQGSFVQDEALANELAARFEMTCRPKSQVCAMYLRNARYAYSIWGAKRKIEGLDTEFPQYLTEDREGLAATTSSRHSTSKTTSRMQGGSLDLASFLKAAETISREVVLGELLKSLISIVIQNAGAQRGLLLLFRDGQLYIEAEGTVTGDDVSVLMSIPIDAPEGAARLPLAPIYFAARTQEPVVADDATIDERFLSDPYVQQHEIRSILCQPILNQGRFVGLIYLENNLANAAFTPARTQILAMLSGQIATSIQNAELIENLEGKVRERTDQLEVRNRFIRQMFGRYLSDEVVESLLKKEEESEFGSQKRIVTVMMSDIRGFTSLSESLPPETVVSMLNNYLSTMTAVIQNYSGTIDEFIGDAILVIFGAPFQRPNDAERAVACAIEMQLAMSKVNAWNVERNLPEIEMGIGINTGEVVVGNIGSLRRAKYGVVGGNVNLAGRIEGFTVGGQILIAQSTYEAVEAPLKINNEILAEPKGVARPIKLYEVKGIGGKYRLELSRPLAKLVDVAPRVTFKFRLLIGKEAIADQENEGILVRLSEHEAEIRTSVPPSPYSDLKLKLLDHNQSTIAEEIYGKVLDRQVDEGCFALHFTSLPPPARDYFDSLV